MGGPIPLPGPWSLKRRVAIIGGVMAVFVVWYLLAARTAGPGAGAPAGFVVLAAGYLLGIRGGVVAGLVIMPLIWALYGPAGVEDSPSLRSGAFYVVVMTGMGVGAGAVSRLQGRAEAARAEADSLARNLDQAQRIARLGYWSLTSSGRLEWSEVLWKAFGFTEEPDDVEEAFARIHPDDEPRVRSQIESMWRDGGHLGDEHRVILPDGTLRWIAFTCEAERDKEGTVVRVFGTGQDITARKHAEAASTRFRHLLDRLEDVYWIGDPAKDRFEYSSAAESLFGYPAEELSVDSSKLGQKVHPDDLDATIAAIGEVAAGKPSTAEFRTIHPDGTVRHVLSRAWPIQGDDQFTAYGIMRDVTPEREVGRLEELDRLKALFMSTAAHELNTPLTPLKLQAAILARRHPGDKAIGVMQRNVARLEALVQDLLDASRAQAGRLKYDIQDDLDLGALLGDVASGAALQAKADGKEWKTDVAPGIAVRGDPMRLAQVFTNLVNNALRFTPEDGTVALRANRSGDEVRVQVADTGLGMTAPQMARLFQPFHQFHRALTGTHKGTGLGLFISKAIVDHHEGRIDVESAGPDKGTTFTVTLPVHSTAASVEPAAMDEEDESTAR